MEKKLKGGQFFKGGFVFLGLFVGKGRKRKLSTLICGMWIDKS